MQGYLEPEQKDTRSHREEKSLVEFTSKATSEGMFFGNKCHYFNGLRDLHIFNSSCHCSIEFFRNLSILGKL